MPSRGPSPRVSSASPAQPSGDLPFSTGLWQSTAHLWMRSFGGPNRSQRFERRTTRLRLRAGCTPRLLEPIDTDHLEENKT